jgi:hypothetical protein
MKPKAKARLKLNKETLRGLGKRQLGDVAGGDWAAYSDIPPCLTYTCPRCGGTSVINGPSTNLRC